MGQDNLKHNDVVKLELTSVVMENKIATVGDGRYTPAPTVPESPAPHLTAVHTTVQAGKEGESPAPHLTAVHTTVQAGKEGEEGGKGCCNCGDGCECCCKRVTMKKNITVLHGVCIIVGTIIGAGIFVSPNSVSKRVGSPAMSICIWVGGGIISTIGAITFLELGTMLPRNGGQMVYLRQAFGGCLAFLSCWLLHVLLGGLRRAIGFLTFGKYFWAVFYEAPEGPPEWANRVLCITVCCLIIGLITIFPNLTLKVIDAVTFFKVAALLLVIVLGFVHLCQGHTEHISVGFTNTSLAPQKWGEAWNSVLWAYNGWISISVMLGEVKDPKTLPRIVGISMSIVTVLYVLAVISYHTVLPMDVMNSDEPLASELAYRKIGSSGRVFYAVAVAVSTLGNAMCASLAASRFLQAGGETGILPGCFGLLSLKHRTPVFALIFLCIVSVMFVSFGNVFKLINTASFTSFAFTSLCAVGLMVMRRTLPDMSRPIKVCLFFPVVTVLAGVYLFVVPWFTNWEMCLLWSCLTALGVPVYYIFVRGYSRPHLCVRLSDWFTGIMGKVLQSQ